MNKAKKNLLEKTYQRFMMVGFNELDPEILEDIADKSVMGFGTTFDEKIFSLHEMEELIKRQHAKSEGMNMDWNSKPQYRYISEDENTAVYADDVFLNVQIEKETIEMYMRFSLVLEYKNDKWLMVHWHASKPEEVESEKDTFGIDTWKEKAEALEKVVKERTADLVVKNRELEIETSLEKVRTVAMGMRQPDDLLNICEVMYQELNKLGFNDLRNAMINIHYDDQAYLLNYDYSDSGGKTVSTFKYNAHPIVDNLIYHAKQSNDHFTEMIYAGKDLNEWRKFRKENGEADDARLDKVDALYYYFYSIGTGAVGISLFKTANEEQLNVLKRFRNVFDLAYKRYVDITTAEAQAREAQIEAALEKVRSRSLAMHKSGEIIEVAKSVFEKLDELNISLNTAFIIIFNEASRDSEWWLVNRNDQEYSSIFVRYIDILILKDMFITREQGKELFTATYHGDEKKELFRYLFTETDFKYAPQDRQKFIFENDAISISMAMTKKIAIQITRHNDKAFSNEENDIVKKFTKVFDQSYTRFLDLQKAEAQARESQIQLALERVRSRTMAMQKSDELKEVIQLVYEQFVHLNIYIEHTGFLMDYKERDDLHIWLADRHLVPSEVTIPWFDSLPNNSIKEAKDNELDAFKYLLDFEEKNKFYRDLFKLIPDVPEETLKYYLNCPGLAGSGVLLENIGLYIENFEGIPYTDEENNTLMRFGKVFQQTYTRFLDLQKAEAQAREAQIEAALERVRSRTMAMHQTSELQEVIHALHKELLSLNLSIDGGSFVVINDDVEPELRCWGAGGTADTSQEIHVPDFEMLFVKNLIQGIKNGPGFFTEEFSQKEKKKYFTKLFGHKPWSDISDEQKNETLLASGGYTRSVAVSKHTSIFIINHYGRKFTEAENDILNRFAKVFEQTYTRFLDLQKAEAQAREAEIELALERLRARTMAMQHSHELADASFLLDSQIRALGIKTRGCAFNIYGEKDSIEWFSSEMGTMQAYKTPRENLFLTYYEKRKTGVPIYIKAYSGEVCAAHYAYLCTIPIMGDGLKEMIKSGGSFPTQQVDHVTYFKYGYLLFITLEQVPEAHDIFIRFAKVFEQTYTRFLDLQKAEAQARESQIEAALEKVRSSSLAMHKSDDLKDVVAVVLEQFQRLGLELEGGAVHIQTFNEDSKEAIQWSADPLLQIVASYKIPFNDNPVFADFIKAKHDGDNIFFHKYSFEEKNKWFEWAFVHTDFKNLPDEFKTILLACESYAHWAAIQKNSAILVNNILGKSLPEDQIDILKRFSIVFEQSYIRFLDLQKAEAQARESQIQLALERVRARTMAMHESSELIQAAELLFDQIKQLGAESQGVAFAICDKDNIMVQKWTSIGVFTHPYNIEPGEQRMYEAWKNGKPFYEDVYEGERQKKYYEAFMKIPEFKQGVQKFIDSGYPLPTWQKNHAVTFKYGYLLFITTKPFKEKEIFLRFGKVFEQTYTRFLDLQKAEAQAQEAKIETALERVRSRTMAMQSSEELAETSAVLFQQLIHLGIDPNRLYIGILEDNSNDMEFWITDEDGSKVSTMFKGSTTKNASMKKMYDGWKQHKKSIIIDMHGKELENYFHYLGEELHIQFRGGLSQKRRWQYIAYFSKGLIGIASPDEQPEETLRLLERFAAVFNLTFTRFNDLKIAEAHAIQAEKDLIEIKEARKKAEDAFSELQATQKQLIQSEKMASLGELTAGIAHEIQNPLNFVNNFSEVNTEMLEELKAERIKPNAERDYALEDELINDVIENSEKINHHGKRAGDIVKGMLQHSRASTGVKELTNINALCDEYLRLSYHGLRAKDKSFNAEMKTDFDASIGKINIIPQDIGRVMLNLYNNAFYACTEQSRSTVNQQINGISISYEPTVSVTTKKSNNHVIITVSDNGNGIPQNIVDKIFQPFFTTKPTGSGTGLGLSLSYDIVKAHGGEIKVESKEGEGSKFIIQLPVV